MVTGVIMEKRLLTCVGISVFVWVKGSDLTPSMTCTLEKEKKKKENHIAKQRQQKLERIFAFLSVCP